MNLWTGGDAQVTEADGDQIESPGILHGDAAQPPLLLQASGKLNAAPGDRNEREEGRDYRQGEEQSEDQGVSGADFFPGPAEERSHGFTSLEAVRLSHDSLSVFEPSSSLARRSFAASGREECWIRAAIGASRLPWR